MHWSKFKNNDPRNIFNIIFQCMFLQKMITGLDDFYKHDYEHYIDDLDMQSDLYEYMFGKL